MLAVESPLLRDAISLCLLSSSILSQSGSTGVIPFQCQQQHCKASINISNLGGAEKENILFLWDSDKLRKKKENPFYLCRRPTESREEEDKPSQFPFTALLQCARFLQVNVC